MEEQAAAQAEAGVSGEEDAEQPPPDAGGSEGIQFNEGSSEGAKRGWDKRGRGRHDKESLAGWTQTADRAEQHGGMVAVAYDKTAAKWIEADSGKEAAQYVQEMKIPPSWKGVHASTDPQAKIAFVGIMPEARDKEGALKREAQMKETYSAAHVEAQKAAKFARVSELASKQEGILEEVNALKASDDTLKVECATVLKLIYHTGIRPGGPESDGTFGATTLQGRHVKPQDDGTVKLQFLGKDHVRQNVTVSDPVLVKELVERAQATGPKGKLFATSASSLRSFTTELDGGGFKPKDFRTLRGTGEALKAIRAELGDRMKPFSDEGEYKKFTMKIAKQVSSILGNTPIVALQSYIDPHVFARLNPKHEGQD
jgi:DNA topoisomerase-1